MKKLLSFLKHEWLLVIATILFNLLFGLFMTMGAVYLQRITDAIEAGKMDGIPLSILVGGSFVFFSLVIRWLGAVVPRYLSEKFSYNIKCDLFQKLTRIPFIKFEEFSCGELQSRIQSDCSKAGSILYIFLSRILNNVFIFVFSVGAMLAANVEATIVAVIVVIIATTVNQFILKDMKKRGKEVQASLAEMTKSLESTFSSIETVKSFSAEKYVGEIYANKQTTFCNNKMKVAVISAIRTLWYSITENLCLYGSIAYLGTLGILGKLSIGEVLMFIYLIKQIITPIEVVLRWLASVPECNASMERVSELMNIDEDQPTEQNQRVGIAQTLNIDDINFGYRERKHLLNDISVELKKGEVTIISGESGAGKTTLLKIIMGIYTSPDSHFAVDGEKIPRLSSADVAYSSLDNSIFPMSVYDNIALGDSNISKKQVKEILDQLGFSAWLRSLPEGIDTEVNENLSGGQKQAIANARVILSRRNVLILDEPFSALDEKKAKCLIQTLKQIVGSNFIVLVTHQDLSFENFFTLHRIYL